MISDAWRYRQAWKSACRRANNAAGSVVFWKHKAAELEADIGKLEIRHGEERIRWAESFDRSLVPIPPGLPPLGARDRENLQRLTDENDRLRRLVETCEEEHR